MPGRKPKAKQNAKRKAKPANVRRRSASPKTTSEPVPQGLAAVDEIEQTRDALRDEARSKLGVTGDEHTASFRDISRKYGLSYYPLVALGLLSTSDTFQGYAFTVMTPEISRTLGISVAAIAAARALQGLAVAVAPLPVASLTQNKPRRALLCITTGIAWSLMTLFTGFVTALAGLIVILALDGLTTGSVTALHAPLVMDSYHPEVRVRALSVYSAFNTFGSVASPLLVGLVASLLGFTWRGVFIFLGFTSLAMTLVSLGLRDPGFGKWDTQQLRASVRRAHGEGDELREEDVALGFWEICRRMLLIPTNRRVFAGFTVFGMLAVPLGTFISFFLEQRWNLGPGARGAFFAFYAACGVAALIAYGGRGEKQFRASPGRVLRAAGYLLAVAVALIALGGLMPSFGGMLACFGLAGAGVAVLQPLLAVALLSIIPANMRPHAQSLAAIFGAVGSVAGALLLGGIQGQYGIGGAMVAVAIPGVLGALIIASAGGLIQGDLDRMIDEVLEDEEIRHIRARGGHLPMLAARGIDFSYGRLQVLFDVDFTVDDGEMVALLGVNGAGKSTLLKVISGIGLPTRGNVRFRGQEITYLDAERRLRLGITQVPGGRAVFGPMTVVENLRAFGYTLARDRTAVDRAIDTSFEAFPALAERRNSLAATLSGGEQQMLGLSKALMLKPRLLLVDELSLGLAPVIVSKLLDMVRAINTDGTAVVLVEQSVSIALNLVEHAYFMEKGEIRFDGRANDLLARDDLLRAVFLHGTGAERRS
jgi:ABC-type branched-subunit amino acid transport system ATPase component/sugar phosphate permease